MEDIKGLKRFLSVFWIYELFQNLVGAKYIRSWLSENYWKVKGGEKVVDIGCGPGDVLEYLPKDITFIGVDVSEEYITAAERRFGNRAIFLKRTIHDLHIQPDQRLNCADLVLCTGLLHHLDDREVVEALQLSRQVLTSTGRFVCIEPAFLVHQGYFSKWIMSRDRGRHVRTEKEWKALISSVFSVFSTSIATNLYIIPYTHIIIECWNES